MRIGVLGAARIAEPGILTPARDLGHRVVAVAARDRARAEEFAARHGIERVLPDYAAVCTDPEVDVVYNPLANGLHGPWNLAAIKAGKHVLSEKPFASNAAEAHAVAEAARERGVTVVEAFHYVYHPVMRRMLELAGGELGALVRVEARFTTPAPPPEDPRWSFPLAGGALMDLGCYGLHASRALGRRAGGGEPTVTAATGKERAGMCGTDESMTVELGFPNGATGRVHCSMANTWRVTLRVVGEAGEALAPSFVQPTLDDSVVVNGRTEHLGTRTSYHYQLEAFRTADPERALADAVANAELIDAAYLAARFPPRPSTEL